LKPYISVVIAARNEEQTLPHAMTALDRQNIGRTQFEVVVVNNGSTDRTSAVASECGADCVAYEPERGTNIARERGWRMSQGRIVAFLDADCEPPPDWLLHISRALSHNGIAAVSGPYDYGFRGIPRLADRFYAHFCFAQAHWFLPLFFRKPIGIIRAGNFAAHRSVLEDIGGLPPRIFWGDDTAIAVAIVNRGGIVRYDSSLTVKSSPRRFEREGLISTSWRYFVHFFREYLSHNTP